MWWAIFSLAASVAILITLTVITIERRYPEDNVWRKGYVPRWVWTLAWAGFALHALRLTLEIIT